MFFHNLMLFTDTSNQYIDDLVSKHYREFHKFLPLARKTMTNIIELNSTEGLGIMIPDKRALERFS